MSNFFSKTMDEHRSKKAQTAGSLSRAEMQWEVGLSARNVCSNKNDAAAYEYTV